MKLPNAPLNLTLRQQLQQFAHVLQASLFPRLEDQLPPTHRVGAVTVQALTMVPIERWLPRNRHGRPRQKRTALATAFLANSIYGFTDTRQLAPSPSSHARIWRNSYPPH